jgi:hypothetical protein
MPDHRQLFEELIAGLVSGGVSRTEAAEAVSSRVGVDELAGGDEKLLVSCEWALRHADELGYFTSAGELRYLLACLQGRESYSVNGRNASVGA